LVLGVRTPAGRLLALNLGGDGDTTGAVYGQPAGAFHG